MIKNIRYNAKLRVAIDASIAAGSKILKMYNDIGNNSRIERKSDNSPLTNADKKSNLVIIDYLNQFDIPIISEESAIMSYSERKLWNEFWIIDPLDGTKEFIKRNGDFTVNIAYVIENKPVMGVIYVPVTDSLYFGEKELGAYKLENVKKHNYSSLEDIVAISTKLPTGIENEVFTIVASLSHSTKETEAYLNKQKQKYSNIDIVTRGSSLKICLVAEGIANVYPRFAPTMEWDTAAGDAIVRAAGKMIFLTDEKTPLMYNKENLFNPFFIVK